MKTSITSALRLFAGVALLLGASAIQAMTYTAGVVYEGNFNENYLNGSPLLAKFEVNSLLEGFGGTFEPGIMGHSYMDAFTVEATTLKGANEGIAGTWSFDPSKVTESPVLYPTKMLIKADGGWYFLEIGLGETSGTWSTEPIAALMPHGNIPGLSHISFYDTAVPIPAAAYLFGSALIGLAGIGYRRKS
jgi:hypothetical protein